MVLNEWEKRASRALTGHYNSARKFELRARIWTVTSLVVGLIAAVLTAMILSADSPSTGLRIGAVIAATGASALGLLQSQLNLSTRAAHHLASGAGYSKIRRMLEMLDRSDAEILDSKEFHHIKQTWAEISQSAPIVPTREWRAAKEAYP